VHDALRWSGAALALCLYIPLCIEIWRGPTVQNTVTWALWVILDAIALGATVTQGGNWAVLAAFVTGGSVVVACTLKSRNFSWTWVETMTVGLVVLSIWMWASVGPWWATIVSSVAVFIASFPQTVETYRKPRETPFGLYAGYVMANILSLFGGKEWSVEERFYYVCAGACCVMILIAASRRWCMRWPTNP
jgi:hypothetical protein